ncbi:MAG: hypothetical protein WC400_02595 [Patescibacteria group bacterium]|jgi:hypothetical protein
MAEPIKKPNGSAKPIPASVGNNKLLPVASQLSQATTNTVKKLTNVLSQSVSATKSSLSVPQPTNKTVKKRSKKWIGWALLLIILALAAGGYYWYTHRTITTEPLAGKDIRTFSTSIVYRSSTIPSGVAKISGGKLTFEDIQLPIIDPEFYAYSIQLAKVDSDGLSEAVDAARFYLDADGYPTNLDDGMPVASFNLGSYSGYNRLQIVLRPLQSDISGLGGVVLDGKLGEGVAVLKFPLDLSSTTGQASFSQGADQDTTNINISLSTLDGSALSTYGWRFEGWLAKMNGPVVSDVTSLGVFDAVGDEARSSLTTKQDLSGYNKLIVSLVPTNSAGGNLVRLLPFSAELTVE